MKVIGRRSGTGKELDLSFSYRPVGRRPKCTGGWSSGLSAVPAEVLAGPDAGADGTWNMPRSGGQASRSEGLWPLSLRSQSRVEGVVGQPVERFAGVRGRPPWRGARGRAVTALEWGCSERYGQACWVRDIRVRYLLYIFSFRG